MMSVSQMRAGSKQVHFFAVGRFGLLQCEADDPGIDLYELLEGFWIEEQERLTLFPESPVGHPTTIDLLEWGVQNGILTPLEVGQIFRVVVNTRL